MKYIVVNLIFFFLLFNSSVQAQKKGKIILEVSGLSSATGKLYVTVFNQHIGFPHDIRWATDHKVVNVSDNHTEIVFDPLTYGKYAIALYHDENNNSKLDKNFWGIPQEGYGFSNNYKPVFRAPRFEEVAFVLESKEKRLNIKLLK